MKAIFSLLLAGALCVSLAACSAETISPTPDETEPVQAVLPADLPGVWQGSGTYTDTRLLLRADGTGALLSLAPADGGAFTEDFFLGTEIVWSLNDSSLSWHAVPAVLPNGAVYHPAGEVTEKHVSLSSGILTLTDGDGTEFFLASEEPVWYSIPDYVKALADWLIGPDAEDASSLYDAFYDAFAAG